MSHIYWELHEIPRPEESYINRNDGRVFLISVVRNGKKSRTVIGRATSETMMHPNDTFKYLYPALWEEYYSDSKAPQHVLSVGMYALSLGIGYRTGLYPLLHTAYGPLYANAIMDYSCYSILDRSDVSQIYPERMAREATYSPEVHADSWWSDFFNSKMTENQNHMFRTGWLAECRKRGITKAWISIDGSNSDCTASKSDLSQKGKAKSHKNVRVVSYLYAVSAEDGTPLSYFVSDGSVVDNSAFQKMAEFLFRAGIEIEGVILDRGFCSHDVVRKIMDSGYQYILMLPGDTYGHTCMMEKYSSEIRWNVRHCVNDKGLFGINEKKQIFKGHPEEANICLYFDGANGSERAIALIRKIRTAAREINGLLAEGKKPSIPSDLQQYLSLKEADGRIRLVYDMDTWQASVDKKGYASIATSTELDAEQTNRIYHLRDASETQFHIMKKHLGFDSAHVHYTEGIENKFAVCFIASIIRSEIVNACKRQKLDASKMIQEIDRIVLMLMPDGIYAAIDNLTGRQKLLLSEFGISSKAFRSFAEDINQRAASPINSQIRVLPEEGKTKAKRGRPAKSQGRASGPEARRSPGRPKGSKNKKTLEREAASVDSIEQTPRRRGRPKGSKNKPKVITPLQEKRKRGRPRKQIPPVN